VRKRRLAYFHFWRDIGRRMNIRDIPAGYVPLESFNRDYEKARFRFSETNRRVGLATRELFVSWFPKLAAPLVRKVIHALLDDPLIGAFGFDPPLHRARRLVSGALGLRGVIAGLLPPRGVNSGCARRCALSQLSERICDRRFGTSAKLMVRGVILQACLL
jgi:hypothetical protein